MGQAMRVKDLGVVVERSSPPTIERKDRQRIVTVSAIVGPDAALGDIVAEGQKIIKTMNIPSGVNIQISGSYEDQIESFTDLGTLALLIIVLVFIVMAAQFESLSYPFIIMLSIPFALSGVILILYMTNTTLNVMSLLGAIMLMGIVVKNGIVLIDYTSLCRERGMGIILSVVTAGKSRLRPVLMTSVTTILGMIPMALGTGQGAEMWRPMGTAVIGGMTISTILTLVLVPTVYCSFAAVGIKRHRRKLVKKREMQTYFDSHKQYIVKKK
jgi:HAE1 family hydrophobic/amphiphilic exporter-1